MSAKTNKPLCENHFGEDDEMTRYAFMSNMEAYMLDLLNHPGTGNVSEFLKKHGIDNQKAQELLLTRRDPKDPYSAIMFKKTSIKKGPDGKDVFAISYRVPRENLKRKLRDLYISLFESNIIDGTQLDETDCGESSGQYVAPLMNGTPIRRKTIYMTQEQVNEIAKVLKEEAGDPMGGGYDAPAFVRKAGDPAYNHKDMIKGGIEK